MYEMCARVCVYARAHARWAIYQQVTIELPTQSPAERHGWGVRSTSTETHSRHTFPLLRLRTHPSPGHYKDSAPAELFQSRSSTPPGKSTAAALNATRGVAQILTA